MNVHSILTDKPPAIDSSCQSDLIQKKLVAIHSAIQNFIKAILAFHHQVRTYPEENHEEGDKVYYKQKSTKGWRGPAKVLEKEGNFVLIRHGRSFYRCYPCHLMKVNHTESSYQMGVNDSTT